jgi:hypothetical protein
LKLVSFDLNPVGNFGFLFSPLRGFITHSPMKPIDSVLLKVKFLPRPSIFWRLYLHLILIMSALPLIGVAQESSKGNSSHQFSGTITATNNGISIIPSFSLGRPAAFFDLSVGGDRFSFDPMLRFGMDGKPWTFVLWGRYKVIKDSRFTLTIGGHPAFLFQEVDMNVQGKPDQMLVSNRYLAGEVNSSYKLTDRVSVGLYYLRGTAIKSLGAQNSNFIAWNTSISDLKIVKDLSMKINPQVFFLKVDENSGFYANTGVTFIKGDFPVQLQGFVNQKIKSTIAGDDLVWNVSLLYNFSNTYSKK